jgi:Cu(I)/Ag(I) efflux system membrane fusion protein
MEKSYLYINLITAFLFSCSGEQVHNEHSQHNQELAIPAIDSSQDMHPLVLTDSQLKLGNITTGEVTMRNVGETLVVNARLAENENLTQVISSRSDGRIEKLYIKETGRNVRSGETLYELYSETLLTLQREYLLAKDQYETLNEPRYESFLKAAERKLLLYGLTKKQVERLAQTKDVQQRITFLAPSGGIVSEINVAEGQYVDEGTELYRIDNFDHLWIEAELYPGEAAIVKPGDKLNVRVSEFESAPLEAKVIFLSPEYRANSQITIIRAEMENPEQKFKPGMQAQVLFTHSSRMALTVPTDAVIRDGKGTHVYVETEVNTFEPRMVKTGHEDFDQVEITDGLKVGEHIAVTGAYLLYSEIVLKHGTDPMAGHNH